jgi:opacity protein-like surface antigen
MGRIRGWSLAVIGLVVVLATAGPASAELFLDLYVGGSIFNDPDFTVTTSNGAFRQVEKGSSDANVTGGGRFGYWFTEVGIPFLGVAGDVSYFEPTFTGPAGAELVKVSVRTVPMTPLVMLRLPLLQAPQYPTGQLNLYAAAGPGFFWTEREATFASLGRVSDDRIDVGVDFRAGIAWFFVPNVKVFTEYRFTHFSLGKESNRGASVEADLDAHHLLFGVGFTFR